MNKIIDSKKSQIFANVQVMSVLTLDVYKCKHLCKLHIMKEY